MKRFSETEKWKDEWFSGLKPLEKLVFLFLIDNCDNAGFFELNTKLNSYLIGVTEKEYLGAIEGLNRGLLGAKDKTRYWIRNFLYHQKNLPLNPENNAHKNILLIISNNAKYFDFDFSNLGANQGLISPIGKGIGIGNVLEGENFEKIEQWILQLKQGDQFFEQAIMSKNIIADKEAINNSLDRLLGLIAQYPAKQNIKDIKQLRIIAVQELQEYIKLNKQSIKSEKKKYKSSIPGANDAYWTDDEYNKHPNKGLYKLA